MEIITVYKIYGSIENRGKSMKAKILAMIVLAVFVAGCVGQTNPYQTEIGPTGKVTFRADLEKAAEVPLYPDAVTLKTLLLSPDVGKITIGFVPDDEYNGFYTVTGYEISYKMILIQADYYGDYPKIEALELNSTEEAYGIATPSSPVIVMIAGAEKTAVTVDGNVVLVEGADMTEVERAYTDLDLAADKMLLEMIRGE